MKKSMHKISLLLGFILLKGSFSLQAKKSTEQFSKSVERNFKVSQKQAIHIENKFGEVNVQNWDRMEMSLQVTITVKNDNEKKAKETLDKINIEITSSDEKISIRTNIDDKRKSNNDSEDLKINYELKIPAGSYLDLSNSFGSVIIDKRTGDTKLKVDFGAATISTLAGTKNKLNFQFCDPVIIQTMKEGTITLKHSKMELGSSENIELNSEMSSSKIETLRSVSAILKFGSIEVNEVGELKLASQMSSMKINTLHESGNCTTKYGAFTVERVSSQLNKLVVNSEFSPVKLSLDKKGSYAISAVSKMGNLKLPGGRVSTKKEDDKDVDKFTVETTKSFEGRVGEATSPQSTIKVNSSFGEVKIGLTN